LAITQATLPWQPTKVGKSEFFTKNIFFVALPFRNGLEYRNGDEQLRSALNVTTLCANTVMMGGVTAEKRLLFCTFVTILQKLAYRLIISERDRPISTMFSFDRHVGWDN